MAKPTIGYFGKELTFRTEIKCRDDGTDMDEAQALLEYYRKHGKMAACTHYNNAHQVYSE